MQTLQSHQPSPSTPSRAAITAMRNRAAQTVLVTAHQGKAHQFVFAQGMLKALNSLLNRPEPAKFAAVRDASMGGYQPLTGFEAAWAALPVCMESLSLVEVQQFLTAQGVQIATDAVANSQLDAAEQQPAITSRYDGWSDGQTIVFKRSNGAHGTIHAPKPEHKLNYWWAFERMTDADGRAWVSTSTHYVTDNFGDLVQVAA